MLKLHAYRIVQSVSIVYQNLLPKPFLSVRSGLLLRNLYTVLFGQKAIFFRASNGMAGLQVTYLTRNT